jgi:two-component system chemotaxis response regulator CheB
MADNKIKILIVDDSAVICFMLQQVVERFEDFELVSVANNGQEALDAIKNNDIDVVTLDINMPLMGGSEACKLLKKNRPNLKIIIVSSLTQSTVQTHLQALYNGSDDYIEKPRISKESDLERFSMEIVEKIRFHGNPHQPKPHTIKKNNGINVLVVDDSSVIRVTLTRLLSEDSNINVIGTAFNGIAALHEIKQKQPDIVLLDVEMPEMDGITVLPIIKKNYPNIKVMMVSSLTKSNAKISIDALALGAEDFIEKPELRRDLHALENFKYNLIMKIKALMQKTNPSLPSHNVVDRIKAAPDEITLQKGSNVKPDALAVISSTGGPKALEDFFLSINKKNWDLNVPIFIVQHMPEIFTTFLAERINSIIGFDCKEGINREKICANKIYLAPGGHHMVAIGTQRNCQISLNQNQPVNFCRPAADPTLNSLVEIYKDRILLVVLTGMGSDGLSGSKNIANAGGTVIAQDKETSVVWGMPGAVAKAGICSKVAPIEELVNYVGQSLRVL